jgi:hypothetical protein
VRSHPRQSQLKSQRKTKKQRPFTTHVALAAATPPAPTPP